MFHIFQYIYNNIYIYIYIYHDLLSREYCWNTSSPTRKVIFTEEISGTCRNMQEPCLMMLRPRGFVHWYLKFDDWYETCFCSSCFVGNLVWTMLCLLDTYHVWSLRACIQRAIFVYPLYLHTICVNSKPRHSSPSMMVRQGTILKLPYFRLGTCSLARLPCQYIGLVSDWRFKKHANMISMGLMLPLLFLCILWRTTLPVPFDVAGVADVAGWDV